MPELPDLEGFAAVFARVGLHRRVVQAHAPEPNLMEETTPQALGRRMNGHAFTRTCRHGKFLFAGMDRPGWLILHFGMTGSLEAGAAGQDRSVGTALLLEFANGAHLSYVTQRKLGLVSWTTDRDEFVRRQRLGPDAMSRELGEEAFVVRMSDRRGMLKTALMDQSVVAGIGNVWSDEILFQCRLWPKVKLADLTPDRLGEIYRAMRRILGTGSRARRERRPWGSNYLVSHRDADGQCPRCGADLSKIRVAGRNSRYCEQCQTERA